jgi:uncharacterized protein YkwD
MSSVSEPASPRAARRGRSMSPATAWLVALVVAGGLAPASAAASGCPGADDVPTAASVPAFAATTRCLLNEQRAAAGLPSLAPDPALESAAAAYSRRMVAESFFAHVAPNGDDLVHRLTAAGYMASHPDWIVGENIAWGTGSLSSPANVAAAWMASPGHRANILSASFAEVGVGVALGTPTAPGAGVTVTTDFGSLGAAPASATPSRPARGGPAGAGRHVPAACGSRRRGGTPAGRRARRSARRSGCRPATSARRSGARGPRSGAQTRSR